MRDDSRPSSNNLGQRSDRRAYRTPDAFSGGLFATGTFDSTGLSESSSEIDTKSDSAARSHAPCSYDAACGLAAAEDNHARSPPTTCVRAVVALRRLNNCASASLAHQVAVIHNAHRPYEALSLLFLFQILELQFGPSMRVRADAEADRADNAATDRRAWACVMRVPSSDPRMPVRPLDARAR